MGDIWYNSALSKNKESIYRMRTRWRRGIFTFEKGRGCLRCGKEEHAEWRRYGGGHNGGVSKDSTNGVAQLLSNGFGSTAYGTYFTVVEG